MIYRHRLSGRLSTVDHCHTNHIYETPYVTPPSSITAQNKIRSRESYFPLLGCDLRKEHFCFSDNDQPSISSKRHVRRRLPDEKLPQQDTVGRPDVRTVATSRIYVPTCIHLYSIRNSGISVREYSPIEKHFGGWVHVVGIYRRRKCWSKPTPAQRTSVGTANSMNPLQTTQRQVRTHRQLFRQE